MAKYQVLSPIEHDFTLYVSKGMRAAHFTPVLGADGNVTGYTAPSGGNGQPIPVIASGVIDLNPLQAAPLTASRAIVGAPPEAPAPDKSKTKK